jgi:GAF domain-containing protein
MSDDLVATPPGEDDAPFHVRPLEDLTTLLLEGASLDQLLDQVLAVADRALPSARAVSVTVPADGGWRTVASTDAGGTSAVDAIQCAAGEGPSIDTIRSGREHVAEDLSADERWPAVRARAGDLAYRCALAVPLTVDDDVLGALNVFAVGVGGLDGTDRDLARRLAAPVATTIANARAYGRVAAVAAQLQEALASRATIERAKGVLMARAGCDAERAFELLRRTSQDHNRKLRDVARDVVDGASRTTVS